MSLTLLSMFALVIVTSGLSGVLGMGGGLILMGGLTLILPVPAAMVVHGVAQLTANGSRALMHRRHVRRAVLLPYLAGAVASLAAFAAVGFIADAALVYLLLGLFPFVGLFLPAVRKLDVTRRSHAVACGVAVTALQLAAGASGPVLDVFFLSARLDKHAVVATKATTQALGHAMKLGYYAWIVHTAVDQAAATDGLARIPLWAFAVIIALALAGTSLGARLLQRLSDASFQRASRLTVLVIGSVYLVKGIAALAA
jgi:uncharacterized membrane protein YfcA